jgi:hypothetical protein
MVDDRGERDIARGGRLVLRNGHDGNAIGDGAVESGKFRVELTMVGGNHGQVREAPGVERPDQRVIDHEQRLPPSHGPPRTPG